MNNIIRETPSVSPTMICVPWRKAGKCAEILVSASTPPAPVRVPLVLSATGEEAAMWAAQWAGAGEIPYGEPVPERAAPDGMAVTSIEMPPFVTTPASPGFAWMPLERVSYELRKGSLRGMPDAGLIRHMGRLVWKRSVWNTWRARARAYAWAALAAGLILGLASLETGVKWFTGVPAIGLGITAIVAAKTDRFSSLTKIIAWCGIGAGAALAAVYLFTLAKTMIKLLAA